MALADLEETRQQAPVRTRLDQTWFPWSGRRLPSHSRASTVSSEHRRLPGSQRIKYTRGPYHPMAQGILRQRCRESLIQLRIFACPRCLARALARLVDEHNHERCNESIGNITLADVSFGRARVGQSRRTQIEGRTMQARRRQHTLSLRTAVNLQSPKKIIQTWGPDSFTLVDSIHWVGAGSSYPRQAARRCTSSPALLLNRQQTTTGPSVAVSRFPQRTTQETKASPRSA